MKKIRIFKRSFGLLLGAVGVTTLFTRCHKERSCSCKQSTTATYIGGQSYTYSQQIIKKTEQKCWELNETTEFSNGGETYSQSVTCD